MSYKTKAAAREQSRRYYRKNRKSILKTVKRYRDSHPEAIRLRRLRYNKIIVRVDDALQSVFKDRPCVECKGVFRWDAMQFDHLGIDELRKVPWMKDENDLNMWVLQNTIGERRGKTTCVSHLTRHKLTAKNLIRALKEIAACELICANCHMCRTADRKRGR